VVAVLSLLAVLGGMVGVAVAVALISFEAARAQHNTSDDGNDYFFHGFVLFFDGSKVDGQGRPDFALCALKK
jgi:hypothetical protein